MSRTGWLAAGALGAAVWAAQRSKKPALTLYGGAGAQVSELTREDRRALVETAGQVVSQGKERPLGLSLSATAGARAAGWGYLRLRSEDEAQGELAAAVSMVDAGALRTFYPNPEAEVRAQGASGLRRLERWCERFAELRPRVRLGFLGYTSLLTPKVAEICTGGGGPMCFPLDSRGKQMPGAAGQALIETLWRSRVETWRSFGLDPAPLVFAAGNVGAASAATLSKLASQTGVERIGLFSFGALPAGSVASVAAAMRHGRGLA